MLSYRDSKSVQYWTNSWENAWNEARAMCSVRSGGSGGDAAPDPTSTWLTEATRPSSLQPTDSQTSAGYCNGNNRCEWAGSPDPNTSTSQNFKGFSRPKTRSSYSVDRNPYWNFIHCQLHNPLYLNVLTKKHKYFYLKYRTCPLFYIIFFVRKDNEPFRLQIKIAIVQWIWNLWGSDFSTSGCEELECVEQFNYCIWQVFQI